MLLALSTKWSERVNNACVSLELIGMVTLTVLLLVVAAVRATWTAEPVQQGSHCGRRVLELR